MVAIGGSKDSILQTPEGVDVGVQYPLATDGDSVYAKDIWIEQSDINTFTGGDITTVFNNLHTSLVDSTANNPKELFIHFNRTTPTTVIGIGAFSGNFSNIKISALVSGPIEITLVDESANNTKYTSRQFDLEAIGFNALRIQFHTTDTVSISNIYIAKARFVISRIQIQRPDDTFVEAQGTQSGNFKVSLEELETQISDNNNSQLKITPYESGGVEYKQDTTNGAFATEDYAHNEIHSGDHFFNKSWVDLANGATYDILLVTPDTTRWSHFLFLINTEAETNVTLYSGTTTSADGTPLLVVNRNPNVGTANTLLAYHTPTVSVVGTAIATYKAGAGKAVGGEIRASNEVVLEQGVKYLARVTNATTSNNWVDWLLDWYEHTNL